MTENIEVREQKQGDGPVRYPVDLLTFVGALLATLAIPLGLGAVLGLLDPMFAYIVVFATLYGGPVFLLVGGVTLFRMLRRGVTDTMSFVGLALLANMALALVAVLVSPILAYFLVLFGSPFAVAWSAIFAWVYRGLAQPKARPQSAPWGARSGPDRCPPAIE